MDDLWWKTLLKWMIWGYPKFWKHPYDVVLQCDCFDKWRLCYYQDRCHTESDTYWISPQCKRSQLASCIKLWESACSCRKNASFTSCQFWVNTVISCNLLKLSEKCRRVQRCSYLEMWRPQGVYHCFPGFFHWVSLLATLSWQGSDLKQSRFPLTRPTHLRGFFCQACNSQKDAELHLPGQKWHRMAGGRWLELKYKNNCQKKKLKPWSPEPLKAFYMDEIFGFTWAKDKRGKSSQEMSKSTALKTSNKTICPHHPLALTIGSCKNTFQGRKWHSFMNSTCERSDSNGQWNWEQHLSSAGLAQKSYVS